MLDLAIVLCDKNVLYVVSCALANLDRRIRPFAFSRSILFLETSLPRCKTLGTALTKTLNRLHPQLLDALVTLLCSINTPSDRVVCSVRVGDLVECEKKRGTVSNA